MRENALVMRAVRMVRVSRRNRVRRSEWVRHNDARHPERTQRTCGNDNRASSDVRADRSGFADESLDSALEELDAMKANGCWYQRALVELGERDKRRRQRQRVDAWVRQGGVIGANFRFVRHVVRQASDRWDVEQCTGEETKKREAQRVSPAPMRFLVRENRNELIGLQYSRKVR